MEKVRSLSPTLRAQRFWRFMDSMAFARLRSGNSFWLARWSFFIQGRRMTQSMWPQRNLAIQRASVLNDFVIRCEKLN